MARSPGIARAPETLGIRIRGLAVAGLVVWASLRGGAAGLADDLVLTLSMGVLAWIEQASAWRAQAESGEGSPRGVLLPWFGLVAALPLALGAGPGVRGGLWLLLLWAGFAWVEAWSTQFPGGWRWLLRGLLLLGIVQAVVGLGQGLLGHLPAGTQGEGLGVASGTLRNPNHYATLLALTLAPALGLWRRMGDTVWDRWLVGLALGLGPLALLASRSRGGLIATGLALALVGLAWRGARRRPTDTGGPGRAGLVARGLAVVGVGLGAVALGRWLGPRFELFGLERRLLLYEDVVRMIAERPLWGHGLGLFRWRFRPYQQFDLADRYDHAHNELLELAAEIGVPLALVLVGLLVGRWLLGLLVASRSSAASTSGAWGVLVALGAAGLHGLVDFGTRIPLNLLLAAGLLALLPRGRGRGPVTLLGSRRVQALGLALGVLVALAAGVELLRLRGALSLASSSAPQDATHATPASVRIEGLERALAWAPRVATFHLRLGILYRDDPSVRSPRLARRHLLRAEELNPWSWRYPRELGRLYDTLGQLTPAVAAHHRALALDPRAPRALGRLADLYLRHDRPADAGRWLRQTLAGDPRLQSTMVLRWRRAGQPDDALLTYWPVAQRGALLRHLVPTTNQGTAVETIEGSSPDPALASRLQQVFEAWMAVPQQPEADDVFPYLEWLLDSAWDARARSVWHHLLARRWEIAPTDLAQERLWNGGFEHPIEGGPLGWQVPHTRTQRSTRRDTEGLDGSWALEVMLGPMPGESSPESDVGWRKVRQTVLVEPGETLVFEGAIRAEGSALGTHLQLFDPASKTVLVQGPKTTVAGEWLTLRQRVEVPRTSQHLRARIALDPLEPGGSGRLWVDGVSLRPVDPPVEGSP